MNRTWRSHIEVADIWHGPADADWADDRDRIDQRIRDPWAPSAADPASIPPPADPQAIRACLTPALAAEFDREWRIVLDRVQQSQDLGDLYTLLNKWRHTAYLEMREPGSYHRMLAKAEQIMRSGTNPDAVPFEQMRALMRDRLDRA